jgi:hypothetical protein
MNDLRKILIRLLVYFVEFCGAERADQVLAGAEGTFMKCQQSKPPNQTAHRNAIP